MISNSLFPLVNKPTKFFRNSSTLIDHAWCNILNEKTQANILDISVSTHKPVLTVIPTALENFVDDSATTDRNIRIHNVNDSTIDSFSKEFDNIVSSFNRNDDPIIDKDKAKLAFSEFYTKLDSVYRKHITIDKVLKSKRNKFDKLVSLYHIKLKIGFITNGSNPEVQLQKMLGKLNTKTIVVS